LVIVIWIYSLFLHREIRTFVEASSQNLSSSRLPRLHVGLVLAVTLMAAIVLEALTTGCHK